MKFGKRGYQTFRVVVLDKRQKRDGAYLEKVGVYNPQAEPTLTLDQAKFDAWVKKGAIISEGMRKLLKNRKAPKSA